MKTEEFIPSYTAPTGGNMNFLSSTGEEVITSSPLVGPNDYQGLAADITISGLIIPRPKIISGGLHAAYLGSEEFVKSAGAEDVRNRMKESWLYVFNVNVFTPQGFRDMAGMYSVFDREGKGRNQTLDFNNLNKILEDSDEVSDRVFLSDGVGFAGVGAYGSGEKTSEQLAKDGSVIIQYGKEGAIDLAEVTSKQYNDRAYVYAIDNPTENVQKVSALGGGSSGLDIVGDGYDDVNGVFSFGVKA